MDDLIQFHPAQALRDLVDDTAQLARLKGGPLQFVDLHELVKIEVQILEANYHVLPEVEAVEEFYYAVVALVML